MRKTVSSFPTVKRAKLKMSFDEPCFQHETIEDYTIQDLFKVNKAHLIDIRVKLLLKEPQTLYPGEDVFVKTACIVSGSDTDFSMYILPNNSLPLTLLSEGHISEYFTGRIWIKLANFKSSVVKLQPCTLIGYVTLSTFALK